MTLVINHHPPLSGNKIFFFLVLILLYSCSTSKKTIGNDGQIVKADTDKKSDTNKEKSTDSMKVVNPKIEEKQKEDVISRDVEIKEKEAFNPLSIERNIALFIPYSEDDERYLQFYGGVKLAAEELELEGLHLNIEAIEARENTDFSNFDFSKIDVVVAPNNEQQIKSLIEKTKPYKTKVVSSWFSLSSVENSPNYLQLKPSLRSHFTAILNHIHQHFTAKDVVIIARNTKADQAWVKYFQSRGKEIMGESVEKPLTEYYVLDDSISFGSQVFSNQIHNKHKKVFIIPNYSYKDENYVNGVLRRLNAEKGGKEIYVYGMPIIKDSENLNFEYFQNLNVRVPSSRWVDYESEDVKAFNNKFYDRYGSLAGEEAYEGFDNMLYISRNLALHGDEVFQKMETNNFYIHTNYDVKPFKADNSTNEVDYYENQHLDVLQFNGKNFVKSN